MKIGPVTIKAGANEAVIGAVIGLTLLLMFIDVPTGSNEMFKQGFGALIAWGAGYAMGKKGGEHNE